MPYRHSHNLGIIIDDKLQMMTTRLEFQFLFTKEWGQTSAKYFWEAWFWLQFSRLCRPNLRLFFCVSHHVPVHIRRRLPLNRTCLTLWSQFLVSFCYSKHRIHLSLQKRLLSKIMSLVLTSQLVTLMGLSFSFCYRSASLLRVPKEPILVAKLIASSKSDIFLLFYMCK